MQSGLLHDIARFEQYTKYKTFSDLATFDHGDYAVEILNKDMRKYIETNKYDNLIKLAIKNHNKLNIEPNLSERELTFCKIIRDADKIDILYQGTCMYWNDEIDKINNWTINPEVLNSFLNCKLFEYKKDYYPDGFDGVLSTISYIFDINFKESFRILKEEDYVNKIFRLFNLKDKENFEKSIKVANDFINENI